MFYEITKNAVREAVAQPREVSLELVNAQQARRALDYLVGFNLSPLLWKKVRRGLSAGRVQSPALRMICEREAEIAAFIAQEYWTLDGEGEHSAQRFPVKLIEYLGTKTEQFSFVNETQAREVERTIKAAAGASDAHPGHLRVLRSTRSSGAEIPRRRSRPRRCSRRPRANSVSMRAARCVLRSSSTRASTSAPRAPSDSLLICARTPCRLRQEAVSELRAVASRLYGPESIDAEVRVFKNKSKERAGGARGDSPDLRRDHSGRRRRQGRRRPASAVLAHLEACGRLPDEPRGI